MEQDNGIIPTVHERLGGIMSKMYSFGLSQEITNGERKSKEEPVNPYFLFTVQLLCLLWSSVEQQIIVIE